MNCKQSDELFIEPSSNRTDENQSHAVTSGKTERSFNQKYLFKNIEENAEMLIDYCVKTDTRWFTLLAEMQSGKTDTYLLFCSELIRLGYVDTVVILCGSSDKELKEQTIKSVDEFVPKYDKFLREKKNVSDEEINKLCGQADGDNDNPELTIKYRIVVIFGSDMKKYTNEYFKDKEIAVVLDESHYAQDKGMRPCEFLKMLGISPTGNKSELKANRRYMISVSATPYSEIVANEQSNQDKKVVYLKPGPGFGGIKLMNENGKIQSFGSDPIEGLRMALNRHNNPEKKTYAIVRIPPGISLVEVKLVSEEAGWDSFEYNSKKKEKEIFEDLTKRKISILRRAPVNNTVIFIKGMLRMGKRLRKTYISFLMEMAHSSNSEVVYQGLLGRGGGYDYNPNIVVYLHEFIIKRGYIQKYISFMNPDTPIREDSLTSLVPNYCRNVKNEESIRSTTELNMIIPVKVNISNAVSLTDKQLKLATIASFQTGDVSDLNREDQSDEIRAQVNDPNTKFSITSLKREFTTSKDVPEKIFKSRRDLKRVGLGSGMGIKAGKQDDEIHQIKLFVAYEDYEDFEIKCGDVILDARTKCGEKLKSNRVTTGKEMFSEYGEAKAEKKPVSRRYIKTTSLLTEISVENVYENGEVKTKKHSKRKNKISVKLLLDPDTDS